MATLPDYLRNDPGLIDVHSHVGVDPKLYVTHSFPFCRSFDVAHREAREVGVQRSVCFPWVTSLYYDLGALAESGDVVLSGNGLGKAPFHFENEQMLRQLYDVFPEFRSHFIPFAIVDTLRETGEQVALLEALSERYPFFGLKVHPRDTRAHVLSLEREGRPILRFARDRDLPILIHTTPSPIDPLSQVADVIDLARRHPDLRWCAAHFCGFHQKLFDEADAIDNLWVDAAAMSIGCDLVLQGSNVYESGPEKIDADYQHPEKVFRSIAERYPDTFMFGTDNPAHSWISATRFDGGRIERLELRSSMAREVKLLSLLPDNLLHRVGTANAMRFLEG